MDEYFEFCINVAEASSIFEKNNSELKKRYLIEHIRLFNYVVSELSGNCGSFGTGYPFYTLNADFSSQLPVIEEQIRYNNELISNVIKSEYNSWNCFECLKRNANIMPDLKQICKPCPNMDDSLKPRKVLGRLPDIDMWVVCKDNSIEDVLEKILVLFEKANMYSSDINPIDTINKFFNIISELNLGIMPSNLIPFDAHIVNYSELFSLIKGVPEELERAKKLNKVPYLPIHPLSYRKKWQYDDTAYNFIHDFLSSFTDFNFNEELKQELDNTRRIVANNYSFDELYNYLIESGPDSVKRRHKTMVLKNRFEERINLWKK